MIEKIVRPCVLNCRDYIPGKPVEEVERELGIVNIDKMASNENPLGPSPMALEAMKAEMAKINRYPESLCVDLTAKLAKVHGIKATQIMVGNGLDDVITIIGMGLIDPDSEVIFGDVSFPAYGNITRKMGGICVEVPLNKNMELDLEGFARAITPKTKAIFICNPNNPTGTICKKADIEAFLKKVPDHVVVVFDEAYLEYADSPDFADMMPEALRRENIIVLRTFSKLYGLCGIRVGYAVAMEKTIKLLLKLRQPFPVNRLAQVGAIAALDDGAFIHKTLEVNKAGMKQYEAAFEEMGLKYYKSQANFIYVEIGKNAQEVFQRMLHDGIIVRPQMFEGYQPALRITVGTKDENERTLASLKKTLAAI